jgi:hypothetical protein
VILRGVSGNLRHAALVGVLASVLGAAGLAACAGDAGAAAAAITPVAKLDPVTTQYIVANPTNIYSNHFVYGTTVVGELARGARVEALGKVPGYEWIQVGRNGQPVGYVPISMLSPANLYVP